jgi:hypothetical protein
VNIAVQPASIAPFTEVEFETYLFEKQRLCRGIVKPSPRSLSDSVLIDFQVWIEPEFETRLVDDDRMYRSEVQLPVESVRPVPLAGHCKDSTRTQPSLCWYIAPLPEHNVPTERVLGGDGDTTSRYVKTARGWIELHVVKRKRKSGKVWENKQAWLHWEEPGGRKRSKYIPKAKLADVEQCVYDLRKPIRETLQLLEKKR